MAPKFLLAILLTLTLYGPANAGEQLKAGIQHFESSIDNMQLGDIQASKSTKPLDKPLWSGAKFNKDLAEKLLKDPQNNSNFWYRIPTWCAGRWESADATTTYMRDHLTGKIDQTKSTYPFRGRETIGHQLDNQGDIWHYCRENVWTHGQTNDTETNSFLFYSHPLRVTKNEVIVLGRMAVFEVNTKGKIISSYKTEVIDTMTPRDNASIMDQQIKIVFDEQGKSVTTIKTDVVWKRVTDFQPINESKGLALRPLFIEFLKDHGLKHLSGE